MIWKIINRHIFKENFKKFNYLITRRVANRIKFDMTLLLIGAVAQYIRRRRGEGIPVEGQEGNAQQEEAPEGQ
jgi:hypothetical protein